MVREHTEWTVSFSPDVSPDETERILTALAQWSPEVLGSRAIHVSPLPGGANNLNFVVEGGTVKAALRIANPDPEGLGIDRLSAHHAQVAAAQLGVAPRILASALPAGDMLSEFVEGEPLERSSFEDPRVLAKVAGVLRTLHGGSADVRRWSPFDEIRVHVQRAQRNGGVYPDRWAEMNDVCWRLEEVAARLAPPQALTHNDLVPQNFIHSAGGVFLVDWDFAGYGSPLFELGSLACTAHLRPGQLDDLLCIYRGSTVSGDERHLMTAMSYVASVREVAWAVAALASLAGGEQVDRGFYEEHRDLNLLPGLEILDGEDLNQLLRDHDG